MAKKTEKSYIEAIFKKYDEDILTDRALFLNGFTVAAIRNACSRKYNEGNIKEKDRITIKRFFDIRSDQDDFMVISTYPNGKLKSTSNFLKERRVPHRKDNIELIAWLVDFEPRPLQNYLRIDSEENKVFDKSIEAKPKESEIAKKFYIDASKVHNEKRFGSSLIQNYGLLVILVFGLIVFFWWFTNNSPSDMPVVKEEQKPDTISKKEPIRIEQPVNEKLVSEEEDRKKEIVESNSLQMAIFDGDHIDIEATQALQKLQFNNYKTTIARIPNLSETTKAGLISGSFDALSEKAANYCFGEVTYDYVTSKINSKMTVCHLSISYNTFSEDGVLITNLSDIERITANGFTKAEAKNNTLKKLKQF